MAKYLISIHSFTDIITNSSSELFIVNNNSETAESLRECLISDIRYADDFYVQSVYDYLFCMHENDRRFMSYYPSESDFLDEMMIPINYPVYNSPQYKYSELVEHFGLTNEDILQAYIENMNVDYSNLTKDSFIITIDDCDVKARNNIINNYNGIEIY